MSERKCADGAGTDRSGDVSCAENRVHEFKIWADVLNYGKQVLKDAGIAEADLDSWYLFEQIFGISRAQYLMCAREKITGDTAQAQSVPAQTKNEVDPGDEAARALFTDAWLAKKMTDYDAALKKRASRIPLQQILGQQEFMGLTFFVNEYVLIPRQDTETLVELILNEQKDKNISILDMCTGSGCIAVSLKKLGGYAHVEGADISKEALKVARRNSTEILENNDTVSSRAEQTQNCVNLTNNQNKQDNSEECMDSVDYKVSEDRAMPQTDVIFRRSDMFSNFKPSEQFDVIVSNPPYIPSAVIEELEPEVRDHEPRGALDGREDGLCFYRILAEECAKHLTPGGHVYFEIGYDQGGAVKELLDAHGFKNTGVIQDLAGKDRVVCGTRQVAGV